MATLGVAAAPEAGPRRAQLRLLNAFELVVGGKPVLLPLSTQRLLVFVALHDYPVQRMYVASSLWLDSPQERAHANLRSTLWRIHRCGLHLVNVTGGRLSLDSRIVLDLRDAEALAHRVIDGTSEIGAADVATLACDLLPDWYDDWVLFERERYRQLRLRALEVACARLTEAGRVDDGLEAGLAAVASEPLRETAHRAVIRAHLAEGNAYEAVRQFQLCRRLLRDHLGIEPSLRTYELVREVALPETLR